MEARIFYFIPFVLLEIALVSFLIFIFVKLLILVFRALHKYLNSSPQRQEELRNLFVTNAVQTITTLAAPAQ